MDAFREILAPVEKQGGFRGGRFDHEEILVRDERRFGSHTKSIGAFP
jgi:hypothetical protein